LIRLACSCSTYLGVALGILLGETLHATQWICAIAAGMFIYIGLCDMVSVTVGCFILLFLAGLGMVGDSLETT
jgi:hypothetical protein